MVFSEFELKRYEKMTDALIQKRRPPAEIRNKVDLVFKIKDQSIIIFEMRSMFNKPDEMVEVPVAKTTFIKKTGIWKVYWHRADMKWHGYDPAPEVNTLEEFLKIVDDDEHACFWG